MSYTITKSLLWFTFEPFTINLLPSLLAVVESEAASDPEPGSVKQ